MTKVIYFLFVIFSYNVYSQSSSIITPHSISFPKKSYDAILGLPNPQIGSMIFDTTFNCLRYYNGIKWLCTYQDPDKIAPTITAWKTKGSNDDEGIDITMDTNENVYIIGYFNGTISIGNNQLVSSGSQDIFVVKYNKSGVSQWAQKVGGSGFDQGLSITVDNDGNVYITGYFERQTNFTSTVSLSSQGQNDMFLAKYNTGGVFQWAQRGGGSSFDRGIGVGVDGQQNVYVTGFFTGTASFGNFSIVSSGNTDVFIAKYTTTGDILWLKKGGGNNDDYPTDLGVNSSGTIVIVGKFYGSSVFENITIDDKVEGRAFIAKYNSEGTLTNVFAEGGNDIQDIRVAIDWRGQYYLLGILSGVGLFGNVNLNASSNTVFVVKYDEENRTSWFKTSQSISTTRKLTKGIAIDALGSIYIVGQYSGQFSFDSQLVISSGNDDIFITKFDKYGNIKWLKSVGGQIDENAGNICVNTFLEGSIFITGGFLGMGASFGLTTLNSTNSSFDTFVMRVVE